MAENKKKIRSLLVASVDTKAFMIRVYCLERKRWKSVKWKIPVSAAVGISLVQFWNANYSPESFWKLTEYLILLK